MTNRILVFIREYGIYFVIAVASLLRFWQLGTVPPSLYWDEVSQGYNAYSILTTGRDEHNELFPISRFQAFGDYKAPVYIYLDVPSLAIFGHNEFAVRFPSAFFGTLTVLLTFFLTRELFFSHKKRQFIALSAAFFLAISPWHIQLSRVAYEANIATFFTVLALFLFFIALRRNQWFLILSGMIFVLSFYAFNAHRIFIPLIVFVLGILYFRQLLKFKKTVAISILIGIILLIPFVIYFSTPESKLRFKEVNIFSDIDVIEESNHLQSDDGNSIISKIIHNRRVLYSLSYLEHYFDFFNPSYLFFVGDENPRFSTQDTGELYLYMLPFILLGIYFLIKSNNKNKYFLALWFLLAPIAAATARETPHALRSETFIPTYEIFAALGLVVFLTAIYRFRKGLFISSLVAFFFIVVYFLFDFLHSYYIHTPHLYSFNWQYGYKEAVQKAEELKDNYDEIIFSDEYGRPYIYVLWYGNYMPQEYWKDGKKRIDPFGFYTVERFGKYNFLPVSEEVTKDKKILFVVPPKEFPEGGRIIDTVKFLNGETAFIIGDNR